MGWSCAAEASKTMEMLFGLHGEFGTFTYMNEAYFMEPSRVEHDDGAITGKVMKFVTGNPREGGTAVSVGGFRIEPNGTLSRAPKALKRLT